jgi:hypothetical protein
MPFPAYSDNAAVVKQYDMDQDGDLDLFIGNHVVSRDFGKIPDSYILKNENGKFEVQDLPDLESLGMITDAVWSDFDADGLKDLIVVGEWLQPIFFKNENGILKMTSKMDSSVKGLWQSIEAFDIDNDGDTDYLLGNWGTNNKFKATVKSPMKMYYHDFDSNGTSETVIAIEKNGAYYPLSNLDELSAQLVQLRKKYNSYQDFAGQTIEQIFDKTILNDAKVHTVSELRSGYLRNEQGKFIFVPFLNKLQVSPITSFLSYDYDNDGKEEVLAAGNYFGVQPFHGRFDSFSGALIKNERDIQVGNQIGLDLHSKSVRHLDIITLKNKPYLLVTINNDKAQVYELKKY